MSDGPSPQTESSSTVLVHTGCWLRALQLVQVEDIDKSQNIDDWFGSTLNSPGHNHPFQSLR